MANAGFSQHMFTIRHCPQESYNSRSNMEKCTASFGETDGGSFFEVYWPCCALSNVIRYEKVSNKNERKGVRQVE